MFIETIKVKAFNKNEVKILSMCKKNGVLFYD